MASGKGVVDGEELPADGDVVVVAVVEWARTEYNDDDVIVAVEASGVEHG